MVDKNKEVEWVETILNSHHPAKRFIVVSSSWGLSKILV
jgi:hypothetical protein